MAASAPSAATGWAILASARCCTAIPARGTSMLPPTRSRIKLDCWRRYLRFHTELSPIPQGELLEGDRFLEVGNRSRLKKETVRL